MSKKIHVLDCTLRDGGYVNDFDFGSENILKIIESLSMSGIEIIELGFLKNCQNNIDKSIFNKVSDAEKIILNISKNQEYCLMIRPDWFDIDQLEICTGKIKTLRFAFHYKDLELALHQAKIAREKGYLIILNPVNIISYSKNKLEKLLKILNEFSPKGVCIVDTFGSMTIEDLKNIYKTFNLILNRNIIIGLHLHENLSLSMGLASIFIELSKNDREIIIDSSVLGIGRVPGNLCTELILSLLNAKNDKKYDLNNIYSIIVDPIKKIRAEVEWGYLPAYAITASKKIHRDYAEYLNSKNELDLNQIDFILSKIINEKDRNFFNKELIENIYNTLHNGKNS